MKYRNKLILLVEDKKTDSEAMRDAVIQELTESFRSKEAVRKPYFFVVDPFLKETFNGVLNTLSILLFIANSFNSIFLIKMNAKGIHE